VNSLIRLFFVILFFQLAVSSTVTAQIFTSISPGNFNDPAVWDQNAVPGPGSQIVIQHEIKTDQGVVVAVGGSILIKPEGTLITPSIENSGEIINEGLLIAKKFSNKFKFRNRSYAEITFFSNENNSLLSNTGILVINTSLENSGTVVNLNKLNVKGSLINLDTLNIPKSGKVVVRDSLFNDPKAIIQLCGIIGLGDTLSLKQVMINRGTIDGCEGGVYAGKANTLVINDGNVINIAYLCLGQKAVYVNNNATTGGDFIRSCCFLLQADAGPDRDICITQSTQIGGSPTATGGTEPYQYTWLALPASASIPPGTSNPVVTPTTQTRYVVEVIDKADCYATDFVVVTPKSTVIVTTSDRKTICAGESVTLDADIFCGSYDHSFQWSPNAGLDDPTRLNPIASPDRTTTYTLSATDNVSGDTDSKSITVFVAPKPFVEAGPDTTIYVGDTLQLYARGGKTYKWSPSTNLSDASLSNPRVWPSQTTTYTVEIEDEFGCTWRLSFTVVVEPRPPATTDSLQVFIPDLFSPNNDGNNDLLLVNTIGVESISFKVFDRTGKLVFETKDPAVGWDGKFEGNDLNIDTYVYVLEALAVDGERITKKGSFQLVR
jgi:gliding motility-associated-like protein